MTGDSESSGAKTSPQLDNDQHHRLEWMRNHVFQGRLGLIIFSGVDGGRLPSA
jgi:hypothetical protein